MDVSQLLDALNEKQREAVAGPSQNMLVLAGAGSGKTRVLVQRIAWLMQVEQVSPHSILAVTFTNKAASEMRARVEKTIAGSTHGMWIGTFHGLAHRLLRMHFQEANLSQEFQVMDSEDQLRLVKRVTRALNLDEKKWPPKQSQWYINGKKDEGLRPNHIDAYGDVSEQTLKNIYQAYQEACDRAGLVDFAELLLRAHELWLNHPILLEHYQRRFQRILVDEFQDTNAIQYALLRMLGKDHGNVMIVGDDDQSIYGWRGARIENIQRFVDEFDDTVTIRLEQNYRSSANILKAANHLISNNNNRLGKDLWTEDSEGERISIYTAFNEIDEARFVSTRVDQWLKAGNPLTNAAVLYRSNAQSRLLEEAFNRAGLKYRIYGGFRFYERQEIKDALAYLRLINNRDDDAAFERIVNTPTRGIGDQTLSLVRSAARANGSTLWQAGQQLILENALPGRSAKAITNFFNLIVELEDDTRDLKLNEQAQKVIDGSGLHTMYKAEKGEKAEQRLDNLKELIAACQSFVPDANSVEEMSPLTAFLSFAALESGEGQADEDDDAVQMMTLHSAKGLEFPLVFIVGVEEGMFPSQQSNEDLARLEEERRLAYVGMTRAMEKLYLCHAESRRLWGQEKFHRPSRFIRELPQECIDEIRVKSQASSFAPKPSTTGRFSNTISLDTFAETGFKLGQRVRHGKFGEGVVLNFEGVGAQSRIQVNFEGVGSKWLVVSYANLEKI